MTLFLQEEEEDIVFIVIFAIFELSNVQNQPWLIISKYYFFLIRMTLFLQKVEENTNCGTRQTSSEQDPSR